MAKPRHLTKAQGASNRGKRLPPRRRADTKILPRAERRRLSEYALIIKGLVEQETRSGGPLSDENLREAAAQLHKSISDLREQMGRYQRYHAAYPGREPAEAFTPIAKPDKPSRKTSSEESITDEPALRRPRQGMPIGLIDQPEQSAIKAFAERIHELNALQDHFGRLPRGTLQLAAAEFECTEDWIAKSMRQQREYIAAYPDEPYYNAHTPRPVGRPKGRQSPRKVIDAIEKARVNKHWLSRNGEGGYNESTDNLIIEKKLIHSLVVQEFGAIHSERTTRRILEDFEDREAVRVAVAEYGPGILQNHLPTINNSSRGPGERGQFDARPFSVVVNYNGIFCTVHGLLVFDDASGYLAAWELLPAKKVDEEGNVHKQGFTDQMSRATVARAVKAVGRFRVFYTDHGYEAIKNYMPFMVAQGEETTALIHSRVGRPRGRSVERGVQLVDGFFQTQRYFVREHEYRRSRKKKKSLVPTFEQVRTDFAAYAHCWNHDPAPGGGPSRSELLKQGPSFFLSVPAPENLAMFALGKQKTTRVPRRDGDTLFWLDNQGYAAYRAEPELYKQIARLSLQDRELDIMTFEFSSRAEDRVVLFSYDGEQTWELAVPGGQRGLSCRRHTDIMVEVEREAEKGDAQELEAFYKQVILGSAKGPLVLNGLARERHFYHHETTSEPDKRRENGASTPGSNGSTNASPSDDRTPTASDAQTTDGAIERPASKNRSPRKKASTDPGSHQNPAQLEQAKPEVPNFIIQIREQRQQEEG
jgi:hypothetical protein